MNNIIKFITKILMAAFLVAALSFLWKYSERFGIDDTNKKLPEKYSLEIIDQSKVVLLKAPKLPNIKGYNSRSIEQKIPLLSTGEIKLEKLEKGYPKLRSKIPNFSDKQDKLDPIAIVVSSGVVDLDMIAQEIADEGVIRKISDDVFTLYAPLTIHQDATLIIRDGKTLRMSRNHGVMLPILGKVFISNAKIIGWDTEKNQPAAFREKNQFRPYITAWCGSQLYIVNSDLSYLGYENPKSYGLTYTSCENDKYVEKGTSLDSGIGWVIDSNFKEMYFGFYSHESNGIVIARNNYHDSIVYGIDPHDRSKNLIIAYNKVQESRKKHGIIVSREVSDSYIFNNISENNAGTGIMIDRNSQNNIIAYNISRNNSHDGLSFYESPNNISYENKLINNQSTGLRVRNSWGIQSQGDVVNDNQNSAFQLYTSDLKKERDLEVDPYIKRAELNVFNAEIIGNKNSDFNLEGFDRLNILNLKRYNSPDILFSGELKEHSHIISNNFLEAHSALEIKTQL